MNKSPNKQHKFATTYVTVAAILSAMITVAVPVTALASMGLSGSETGILLFLPLVALGLVVGIVGIVNLVAIPIFLFRRFLTGKYIVLAVLSFIICGAVTGYEIWAGYNFVKTQNNYEQLSKEHNAERDRKEATARSEATVEQATELLNSCKVFGFSYTGQNGTDNQENAEATSTGILLYRIDDTYRMHIADRMIATMVPIARSAQHTCPIQFWHDGDSEQFKDRHWYFRGELAG